jgi:hypothetical protein
VDDATAPGGLVVGAPTWPRSGTGKPAAACTRLRWTDSTRARCGSRRWVRQDYGRRMEGACHATGAEKAGPSVTAVSVAAHGFSPARSRPPAHTAHSAHRGPGAVGPRTRGIRRMTAGHGMPRGTGSVAVAVAAVRAWPSHARAARGRWPVCRHEPSSARRTRQRSVPPPDVSRSGLAARGRRLRDWPPATTSRPLRGTRD